MRHRPFPAGTPGRAMLVFFSGSESYLLSAALGEKREAIGRKSLSREVHGTALRSRDDGLMCIIRPLLGCSVNASLKKTQAPHGLAEGSGRVPPPGRAARAGSRKSPARGGVCLVGHFG